MDKEDLASAIATFSANLAGFLLSGWLMMLVLGWLGIVGITYSKALVIILLIDFIKSNMRSK